MCKSDGTLFWAALSSVRKTLPDAESIVWITIRNVSRRKENEAILRKNDERFKYAIEATRDGIWDWDIPSGKCSSARNGRDCSVMTLMRCHRRSIFSLVSCIRMI